MFSSVLTLSLLALTRAAVLTVSTTGGNASSPLLYGLMFEDINHSGDGGIHGQVLQNNGFQGDEPGLTAYASVGDVVLTQDTSTPLSTAITSSLKISVLANATGQVGFSNSGYNGVPVNADTYSTSFWVKGNYTGSVTLALVGTLNGQIYGSGDLQIASNVDTWTLYETNFTAVESPDGDNIWRLTFDAEQVAGAALWFDLVQLFPSTYFRRKNGLRNDVATFLDQLKPSFMRFPGGNNLEGQSPDTRWKWNETIGPLENRPGRQGDWGYPNTDALGLMEYLQWCDDMKMTPVLTVWVGLTIPGIIVNGSALEPYINDTLNELEFLFGATTTPYGSLRASLGHPDPYNIPYLGIGNEDNYSNGCESYPQRFTQFVDAIGPRYPDLILIASTENKTCLPSTLPPNTWLDYHHYLSAPEFVRLFNEFDNIPRTNGLGILVGEFANTSDDDGRRLNKSTVRGAVAEAVYMIGIERNSDLVHMAAYAPLIEHFELTQWLPNLFGLDSRAGSLTPSPSFWSQYLFSTHRGDTILPVSSDTNFGPMYWVASSRGQGEVFFVKLANYGGEEFNVTVRIPDAVDVGQQAVLKFMSAPAGQSNYPFEVMVGVEERSVNGTVAEGWTFDVPPWSVLVLTVS